MELSSVQNRRSNFRVNRGAEHFWQLNIDDSLITRNVVDISATGLRFKAPQYFKIHEGQVLKLHISLEPGDSFECVGRVLWMRDDAPHSSTMNTIGIQFDKLPARVDSFIVQELFKQAMKARWKDTSNYDLGVREPAPERFIDWDHILKQAFVLTLIASFLVCVRFYEKSHPQDSIEYRFNQGLAKKLNSF